MTPRSDSVTRVDDRKPGPSVLHGAVSFAELLAAVRALEAGDLLLFTDWRGDPDERPSGVGAASGRHRRLGRGLGAGGERCRRHSTLRSKDDGVADPDHACRCNGSIDTEAT